MIPQSAIIEWSNQVPWQTNEQVEQDLVICRSLVAIFNDEFLADSLAFRGGTALHKLYLHPQPRYSEDIDLVQIRSEPIKETLTRLRDCLSFLGKPSVVQKRGNNTLKFRFESEIAPVQRLRLKIEINCREHFTELGWQQRKFSVDSQWFQGECELTTYRLEEMLGTKLRALYQRRKGRDLYDLYQALTKAEVDLDAVVRCYHRYMEFSTGQTPTQKQFILNMESKLEHPDFGGDLKAIIRPTETYDQNVAYDLVRETLIERI
jgi:predicted nucleotidyltransferase component of viral defense system